MRTLHSGTLLALALAALLLAAACGDDDTASGTQTAATDGSKTATSAEGTPTGASSTPTKAGSSPNASTDDTAAALDELKTAAKNLTAKTYKASYTAKGDETGTGALDGTLTLAAKPPLQLFGITGKVRGEDGTIVVIDDGTTNYLCFDSQGEKACLKSKSATASSPIPLPAVFSIDEVVNRISTNPETKVTRADGQTIAGEDTRCYDVASPDGTGKVCVATRDGIVMLLDGTFSGSRLTMRATAYSSSPGDDDFKPPYEVTELP